MADTIGSMAAVIRATSGQFDADLKQAAGSVDRFKRHVDSAAAGGGKGGLIDMLTGGAGAGAGFAAGFAAVTAAVAAVTTSFKKLFETFDEAERISDLASQINATTNELTSLRFAADISGSSGEILDASLEKLTQKLGEARSGSAATAAAF